MQCHLSTPYAPRGIDTLIYRKAKIDPLDLWVIKNRLLARLTGEASQLNLLTSPPSATFLQYEEHLKDSKRLLATYGGPSSNLALKSSLEEFDDDEEEDEYEDDDNSDDTPSYDDMTLFVKRFTKGDFKGRFQKKKTRSCYNCERPGHFAEDCPYEKREDKPRFPRKEVAKKLPNPLNKEFKKKAPHCSRRV